MILNSFLRETKRFTRSSLISSQKKIMKLINMEVPDFVLTILEKNLNEAI